MRAAIISILIVVASAADVLAGNRGAAETAHSLLTRQWTLVDAEARALTERLALLPDSEDAALVIAAVDARTVSIDPMTARLLSPRHVDVAAWALARRPYARWADALESALLLAGPDERRRAVRLLARCSGVAALERCVVLAAPPTGAAEAKTFELAIAERLKMGRDVPFERLAYIPNSLWVAATRAGAAAESVSALTGLLGRDPALDLLALRELASLNKLAVGESASTTVRAVTHALRFGEPLVAKAALHALARLDFVDAVDQIVGALEHSNPVVSEAAAHALQSLSRHRTSLDNAGWHEWWSAERAWLEEPYEEALEAIHTGSRVAADTALLDLSGRRVFATRISRDLAELIPLLPPDRVSGVCAVLAQLADFRVVATLRASLPQLEPEARESVMRALSHPRLQLKSENRT